KRFIDFVLFGPWCIVFLISLIGLLGVPAHAQIKPQVDLSGKNVLILHALESSTPLSSETNRGLLDTLRIGGMPVVNLFFESMDLRRNPGPELRKLLVQQMHLKWSHRKADMVITVYPEALEFVLNDCRDVFPHVPIIALHLPQDYMMAETGRRIIGHFPTYDITGTIDIALKLVPRTKRVYVVSGAHKIDKWLEDQARLASKKWEEKVEFLYLSHLTIEDILAAVSKAPPDSVILYLALTQDVAGKGHTGLGFAHQLSQVSTVPVFGMFESALGYGVTGGALMSWNLIGKRAGELAIDILKGVKTLDEVPPVLDVPSVPMFDWKQLRRWKLSEAALPKGSIVINREVTFWDFKYYFAGGLALCLLESLLIAGLLLQRRRRRVAEESVRKTEEKYRSIFEGAVEGISESSPQGQILTANPALARMLGYDSPGEYISAIYDPAHQVFADPGKRAEYVGLLEKQDVLMGFECELLRRDGRKIWASINSRRVCGPDGKTLYYSGFFEDITEHKRADEELRKHRDHLEEMVKERTAEVVAARDQAEVANRTKSTFLANMSHELRTPLNSMLGVAQLMERDPRFPGQHRDTLKILSRSGSYLLELINDVLEMSKIEAGKMPLVKMSFDLRSFLGDLEEMIRLRAQEKGLKFFFEYMSPVPQYIETDVRKLRQILVNLLGNAIKFTGKGHVTLRINFKEDMQKISEAEPASPARLEFEIEDTGSGISPEDTQRIFDPFVQLNSGQAAREGTGLGLTLSRMFIEQLGGKITVRSQVGRGSTFAFDIAVKSAEGAMIHSHDLNRRVIGLAPGQPSYRLLVVDDSLENRLVLRRLLEQGGFSVLEAASGQEAVDLHRSSQPHLIWMDIRMPGMDGYEATRRIREAEEGRLKEGGEKVHTPIIALTAHVMEDKESSSQFRVFDDLVYKPFLEIEIFDKLEKHLGVQFAYQPFIGSEAEADRTRGKDAVRPSDLAILPMEWLQEFFQMLRKGRSKELLNLIDQLQPEHADLAQALADLVRTHKFDKLMPLAERSLRENSHG
ncbi:MAG TPA: ATP-binding protein, partial [Thermodesulfobacteriota bacterium]|nr:ATP-binding protein [Thermodesulfobacteriota bacterium]